MDLGNIVWCAYWNLVRVNIEIIPLYYAVPKFTIVVPVFLVQQNPKIVTAKGTSGSICLHYAAQNVLETSILQTLIDVYPF